MDGRGRSGLAAGVLLVVLGGIFLVFQFIPGLAEWIKIEYSWPLIVVGVGLLLLVIGLLTNEPDMVVPACIVGGIGVLLYWQKANDRFGTWAYAWTLIPGFAGIGAFLSNLLKGDLRRGVREGGGTVIVSLILFLIFGSLFGGLGIFGPYWPVLLIVLGLWIVFRAFFPFSFVMTTGGKI